ncbi:MAG: putative nucleotidyltransferase substrate binding domain-containing protein [Wenzhouxiangella sp.]
MHTTDARRFLSQVAPFSELSVEQLEVLATRFEPMQWNEQARIGVFEPAGKHDLHVIVSGAVSLLDGDGKTLEQRGEGELFGHAICFGSGPRDYAVVASEALAVLRLPCAELQALCRTSPIINRFFSASPGARLREAEQSAPALLAELALRPPVTSDSRRSIADGARLMAQHLVSCLPIVDDGQLVGILTDRDLRNRVLGAGYDPARPIADVMTANPVTGTPPDRLEDALLLMMQYNIHHLPIVDEARQLIGIVSSGDLLRLQSPHPLRLVRDIQRAESSARVAELARMGPGLLARMSRQGNRVTEVGRVAGMMTDACTRRLLKLAEAELGPAPMAWTWLAFGSQARLEQGLISDQDNGLLLAETPDREAAEYFQQLADFVCDGLNEAGYVYCPGGVMAKGEWRLSYRDWRKTFAGWILEPAPKSVMQSSIFFDLRGVAGDLDMAARLHAEVLTQARESKIFRRFLAAESMGHRPPIGLFRQFVQEHEGEKTHGLNLKKRGVIPIVDLARVRALEGAIPAVHTEERLRAAAAQGIMNERDADDLIHALRFIGNVRLRHQVALYERGEKPNHLVDPDSLSGLHRRYLRSAFGIVQTAQEALANRYQV